MVSHRNGGASDPSSMLAPGAGIGFDAIPPAPATLADPALRAAYESIMEVGLRRTTMAEVARRARISRMTLYRRHADMNRLLSALLETELVALVAARRAGVDVSLPAAARLAALTSQATADVAAHPILDRVLRLDPQELLPLIVDRFGSTQRSVRNQLVELIAAGQAATGDSSIRAGDPQDMAVAILVTAQSFVFSHHAIEAIDPKRIWVAELRLLIAGYLKPSMSLHE